MQFFVSVRMFKRENLLRDVMEFVVGSQIKVPFNNRKEKIIIS